MNKKVWAVAAIVALTVTAQAQTSRGTVSGTITDPSGAVLSGAMVVLTRFETGARRAASSNEAGIYRFDAVDLGVYDLKVTETGFKPFLATGFRVEANRVATIDLRLEVGSETTAVQVIAEAEALTVRDGPLRGGNFLPRQVSQLPLIELNPISLARTLPGVIQPSGSFLQSQEEATEFSVNGQRVRGNNFLLDGTENNDIAFTGVALPFRIADAVEGVSVQTGNYSVEFGRASGGVFNVITKSGTNNIHGALFWRYQSQRFNSVSNLDKLTRTPKSAFSHNVSGLTIGGPVRKDKTFFFAGFQQDTRRSTTNFPLVVPTAAAVARLRSQFPSNPRLDLYLNTLGYLRGSAAPVAVPLGLDPQTGMDRGPVQFATAPLSLPKSDEGPQWLVRSDHQGSEAHRLSWRYIYDSRVSAPLDVLFPGFVLDTGERNQNFLFIDSYTFGPSCTNEFRASYGRLQADQSRISPQSDPLAHTLPRIAIQNISSPGVPSGLQFRHANNVLSPRASNQSGSTTTGSRSRTGFTSRIVRQAPLPTTVCTHIGSIRKVLFVFIVLEHGRRKVLHCNVTEHPTAAWTAQQIVEAFADREPARYLIRDRDSIYGTEVRLRINSLGMEEVLTAPQRPWQNPYTERLIGSIRRECLNHYIILNARHLKRTLSCYFRYYHSSRTHLSLGKQCPFPR